MHQKSNSTDRRGFSAKKRFASIRHALHGVAAFFLKEHNAFIHLTATFIAASLALVLKVTTTETLAIIIVAVFVWSAELLNTAIEKIADFVCPEKNASIKYIKDVSAAGVFVSAIAALATGCIIFIPKIIALCK